MHIQTPSLSGSLVCETNPAVTSILVGAIVTCARVRHAFEYVFLRRHRCMKRVLLNSIFRAMPLNSAIKSNVSKSVFGLRHFTKSVYAICNMLSVREKLLELWIRDNLLWIFSLKCFKFSTYLGSGITFSQCMECWKTLCGLVPPVLCIYHRVTVLILSFLSYK